MLKLENISFSADTENGKKEILKDITLEIDGGFTAITGPNGGGKSTLAKIIAGIYRPNAGKIYLDGKDITDLDITGRAKAGIGFAFQQPVRFKGITVKDLITLASGKKIGVSEACEYLSEVGLCARDYINREVNASLSGGELKRIEIATVLARRSPVTVFDEPEAGIDLWSFGNLISVFEKMHRETSGTIIITSHQERILSTADERIVIADGSVKSRGASEEILPTLLDSPSVCKILTEKL